MTHRETEIGVPRSYEKYLYDSTIFIACPNVFNSRPTCKIGRELLSFFPAPFDPPKFRSV